MSVLLVAYMFAYIWALGDAEQGPVIFMAHLRLFDAPAFKLLEVALIAGVTHHAADGVGLMIVERHNSEENRKLKAQIVLLITVIMTVGHLPLLLAA
ncbi:MAG: hypothetical protein M5R36_10125 [Deltaproteobacteria bacterium]|nr:hypothetical protein [Deltaproteobacteria bacterium]